MSNWLYGEILKAVFPLLDGEDLVSCMMVCRQWRDIAKDDFFWKCICSRRWPAICKQSPPNLSYHNLFVTFSFKPSRSKVFLPPRLSFNDLVFYVDMWSEETLIFSEAVSGMVLRAGMKSPPSGMSDILKAHLNGPDCKMIMQVEPMLTNILGRTISVSILVNRKDTNKMARIMDRSLFDYVDSTAARALAFDYLSFSPRHPFISDTRAWASLLFLAKGETAIEVFALEIDFCDAARTENEVLWLFDMLDWK